MSTLAELVDRLAALDERAAGQRVVVGIAGAPGAGKSTLAEAVTAALSARLGAAVVAYVPMDGYHLSNAQLDAQGLRDRKGAVETFDGWGYVSLLRRIRRERDNPVYAPGFDRTVDEGVAATYRIDPATRVVVTEGNYLLVDAPPWREARELLDEVWYCDEDEGVRRRRLVERHMRSGRSEAAARAWARDVDGRNAALITATAPRADLVVHGITL